MERVNSVLDKEDPEDDEMTLKATFEQIEERDDIGPDRKLVEAIQAYQLEHPNVPDVEAHRAVFIAMPDTHRAYLDSNGEK